MDFSQLSQSFSLGLAVLAALSGAGLAAALMLLRDHTRIEQHARSLEHEVERLQDCVFELADREERYRSLVETQGDIIVRCDADGRITYANEAFARLTGRSRVVLSGQKVELKAQETGPARRLGDGSCLFDQAIQTDQGVRWIAWVETKVTGPQGVHEIQRAGRDITERVAAEKALQEARIKAETASEAKSRFLATVSHEVRTPLNGILGMADLLHETSLTGEQQTYVRAVRTSGEALLSLIDEILDFSRIEAGRIDLHASIIDLYALIEGVVEMLAPRAQGKGIEIAASIAPGVPRKVFADADRLRQVLANVAGNAIKFTEAGGVGILVDRGIAGRIVISIADTGLGIAPDRLPFIFDEFEQADSSPSRKHEGIGLGLAISQRIVTRMQGTIEVESEPGQGATFRIDVPLPEAGANSSAAGEAPDMSGQRLLFVSRSPYEVPFIATRLREAGAHVACATGLADFETMVDQGLVFDTVLVDCALGEDEAKRVSSLVRQAMSARCLVLLSPFERRDLGSPTEAGFDGYLVKPIRLRSLFERLNPAPKTDGHQASEGHSLVPQEKGLGRVHVLLAEDNDINALVTLKALDRFGASADWARNGREAIKLFEEAAQGLRHPYDLALIDVRMPELDGCEVVRRIRGLEEQKRQSPLTCVALTANAFREDRAAAFAAGFDHFLPKPFERDDLARLLEMAALQRKDAA